MLLLLNCDVMCATQATGHSAQWESFRSGNGRDTAGRCELSG